MTIIEFFLQPDIAYLFLVAGAMLVVMATLTPGTGVLELAALFVLVIAGWQVYNLPINGWAMGILILGVIPFLLAVRRSGNLLYLFLAIVALIIGSVFLFQSEGPGPAVSPALAIVASILAGGFMWLITEKTLEASRVTPSHDLGGVIGAIGITKSIVHEEGAVMVAREEWSARSEEEIPEGVQVRVVDREGFVLWVEPVEEHNTEGNK